MLERDIEVSLSVDASSSGDSPWYAIASDDVPRIQFLPPSFTMNYSSIWWNPPSGLATQQTVAGAGVVTFAPAIATAVPQSGREGGVIQSRLSNPTSRSAAIASLVLRGPNNTFAEFGSTNPGKVPYMQLCDATGKGWKFSLLADGTGFAAASAVSTAMQAQMLGDATWVGADGRTVLGSERSGTAPGSLRIASQFGKIEVNWATGKTYIRFKLNGGVAYYDVAPDLTGALTATVVP